MAGDWVSFSRTAPVAWVSVGNWIGLASDTKKSVECCTSQVGTVVRNNFAAYYKNQKTLSKSKYRKANVRCCLSQSPKSSAPIQSDIVEVQKCITAIACDVDGTLLDSNHYLDPSLSKLIVDTMESGIVFFPATGKSRAGAMHSFGPPLSTVLGSNSMGVFLQGLLVYGQGGELIYEKTLPTETISKVVQLSSQANIPWIGYLGDRLVVEKRTQLTDSLVKYHEPRPEAVNDVCDELGLKNGVQDLAFHKMLVIDESSEIIDMLRPQFETELGGSATLTQAQADMLEILPLNASKGLGVRLLLKHLEIPEAELLAIGDAENDLEMLKLAGIGVAMGNALPSVKQIADEMVASNNELGVAEAIRRFVKPKANISRT
uniref:Uncharacterized protein n=1 Tax=Timspurckia oligopyrenoides TaxID=708627 RepID=A0A7S1ESZ3_9RHOD|mmetsp:Transcript_6299/g.11228  ORF Transcript_6299/g.11228 Transcript_6299/m.11228 type:complete len:375 (+) Transcript_6299:1527-2651(+)